MKFLKSLGAFVCLLLLFTLSAFATTIPVTGTIQLPDGSRLNGAVRFYLSYAAARDTTNNNITVASRVQFPVQNGTLPSTAKIVPNDVLQPQHTFYTVQYLNASGGLIAQNNFIVQNGASFDLGSATPTPVTTSNLSFGNLTGLTQVSTERLGNIRFCDQFPGATADAKINACVADLPSSGGTADARGLQGAQTLGATITITKPVWLILGHGTYTASASPGIVLAPGSKLSGVSMDATVVNNINTGGGKLIQTTSASDGDNTSSYVTIEDIQLSGNASSGDGVYAYAPFGVFMNRTLVTGHGGRGIHLKRGTGAFLYSQNFTLRNSFVTNNAGGGIYFEGEFDGVGVIDANAIDGNSKYGFYSEPTGGTVTLRDNEFSRYNGANDVPVCINGGSSFHLISNNFENIGASDGVTVHYAVRPGRNCETQADATSNTFNLEMRGNYFRAPSGQSGTGPIRNVLLRFLQQATLAQNKFEKGGGYAGAVYAYEWATGGAAPSRVDFNANTYSALDAVFQNPSSATNWIAMDDINGVGRNEVYTLSDAAGRTPIHAGFVGEANDRFQIDGLGRIVLGPGGATAPTLKLDSTGLVGTVTNDNATAGYVGEYLSSTIVTGSSVSLSSAAAASVTSITLTAGDWDVSGVIDYTLGASTSVTNLAQGITAAAGCAGAPALGGQDTYSQFETAANVMTNTTDPAWATPLVRVSTNASVTVCLISKATFTVSTAKAYGTIRARRVR